MDSNQYLSLLFSRKVSKNIASDRECELFWKVAAECGAASFPQASVGEILKEAYQVISRPGLRDDYFFRSSLVQKIVFGRHSLNTTSLINEFRIGKSIADICIINGSMTAYEIKSDRDSLQRLRVQLEDYEKVCRNVYITASENRIAKLLSTVPKKFGILTINRRGSLQEIRESADLIEFNDSKYLCDALRLDEAIGVLTNLGVEVPALPNTQLRSYLRSAFSNVDKEVLSDKVRETLLASRAQRHAAKQLVSFPKYLRSIGLSTLNSAEQRDRYLKRLNQRHER